MAQRDPDWASPSTRTWVLRRAPDTAGELFEQRVEYAPGSPFPPPHFHPAQRELFEVEQGEMLYIVDGEDRRVAAGESLELPAGAVHKARNASASEPSVVRWETRPALRSESFFATVAMLRDAGALERALLAQEYRDVFRMTGVRGAAVPLLALLARLLGRRLPRSA